MGFLYIHYLQIRNFSSYPIFINYFVNFALFSYCIDYGFLIELIVAPVVMFRVHDDSAHLVIKLLVITPPHTHTQWMVLSAPMGEKLGMLKHPTLHRTYYDNKVI